MGATDVGEKDTVRASAFEHVEGLGTGTVSIGSSSSQSISLSSSLVLIKNKILRRITVREPIFM